MTATKSSFAQAAREKCILPVQSHAFEARSNPTLPRNVLHQIFSVGDRALEIVGILAASPVDVFLPDGQKLDLPWRT